MTRTRLLTLAAQALKNAAEMAENLPIDEAKYKFDSDAAQRVAEDTALIQRNVDSALALLRAAVIVPRRDE